MGFTMIDHAASKPQSFRVSKNDYQENNGTVVHSQKSQLGTRSAVSEIASHLPKPALFRSGLVRKDSQEQLKSNNSAIPRPTIAHSAIPRPTIARPTFTGNGQAASNKTSLDQFNSFFAKTSAQPFSPLTSGRKYHEHTTLGERTYQVDSKSDPVLVSELSRFEAFELVSSWSQKEGIPNTRSGYAQSISQEMKIDINLSGDKPEIFDGGLNIKDKVKASEYQNIVVKNSDGEAIGLASITEPVEDENKVFLKIEWMTASPESNSKGIGKALLENIKERMPASSNKQQFITLEARTNGAASAFSKLGFELDSDKNTNVFNNIPMRYRL